MPVTEAGTTSHRRYASLSPRLGRAAHFAGRDGEPRLTEAHAVRLKGISARAGPAGPTRRRLKSPLVVSGPFQGGNPIMVAAEKKPCSMPLFAVSVLVCGTAAATIRTRNSRTAP